LVGGGTDRITGIWGSSADDVWMISAGSNLRHYTKGTWSVSKSLAYPQALNAIWGSGPNDVWVVGNVGSLLHFDGTSWEKRDAGTVTKLAGVSGTAKDDVWIVGDGGTILHFDTKLETVLSPTTKALSVVRAVSKSSAWALGSAIFLRYGT
jgi:hypothetical protein